jgi:hypothetical protein
MPDIDHAITISLVNYGISPSDPVNLVGVLNENDEDTKGVSIQLTEAKSKITNANIAIETYEKFWVLLENNCREYERVLVEAQMNHKINKKRTESTGANFERATNVMNHAKEQVMKILRIYKTEIDGAIGFFESSNTPALTILACKCTTASNNDNVQSPEDTLALLMSSATEVEALKKELKQCNKNLETSAKELNDAQKDRDTAFSAYFEIREIHVHSRKKLSRVVDATNSDLEGINATLCRLYSLRFKMLVEFCFPFSSSENTNAFRDITNRKENDSRSMNALLQILPKDFSENLMTKMREVFFIPDFDSAFVIGYVSSKGFFTTSINLGILIQSKDGKNILLTNQKGRILYKGTLDEFGELVYFLRGQSIIDSRFLREQSIIDSYFHPDTIDDVLDDFVHVPENTPILGELQQERLKTSN